MSLEERQKAGARSTAAVRFLTGMLATLTLGGCLATIKAEDKRVFLPALRAGINLDESDRAASEPQTGHALEFEFARTAGSGNQSLASGDHINLNDTTFIGPQPLRNEFEFSFVDMSWRWRKFFREKSLGLELLGGVAYSSLGLAVTSPAQRDSEHFGNIGGQGRVGLIWRLDPNSSLQARVGGFASGADQGVTTMTRYELFYAQALGENITLRAGYAGSELFGTQGAGMSDFHLLFSGPALVLDWDFNASNSVR